MPKLSLLLNGSVAGQDLVIRQRQLKKLMYEYRIKEIETIIRRNMQKENTAEAIVAVFDENFFNSLHLIQRAFELEECVIGKCGRDTLGDSPYIKFNAVLDHLDSDLTPEQKDLLQSLRNAALHTHIPVIGSYNEGINLIEGILDKNKFTYKKFMHRGETK